MVHRHYEIPAFAGMTWERGDDGEEAARC